jgi:hypothetical protein
MVLFFIIRELLSEHAPAFHDSWILFSALSEIFRIHNPGAVALNPVNAISI